MLCSVHVILLSCCSGIVSLGPCQLRKQICTLHASAVMPVVPALEHISIHQHNTVPLYLATPPRLYNIVAVSHACCNALQAPAVLATSSSEWVAATRKELTELMWSNAGIVRNTADMQKGLTRLSTLCMEVKALVKGSGVSTALTELQNLATVGELIMASALQRKESRGLHYCKDFPFASQEQCHPTVIKKSSMRRRNDLSKSKVSPRTMRVQPRQSFGSQVSQDNSSRKARELSRLRSLREE